MNLSFIIVNITLDFPFTRVYIKNNRKTTPEILKWKNFIISPGHKPKSNKHFYKSALNPAILEILPYNLNAQLSRTNTSLAHSISRAFYKAFSSLPRSLHFILARSSRCVLFHLPSFTPSHLSEENAGAKMMMMMMTVMMSPPPCDDDPLSALLFNLRAYTHARAHASSSSTEKAIVMRARAGFYLPAAREF